MTLMVKLFGVAWNQSVLQIADDTEANKVVVPHHVVRYHKEPKELFR